MTGRLIGFLRAIMRSYERRRLQSEAFVLVSNNCWGLDLYRDLNRPYNTPFIGLYIAPEHYLALLEQNWPDNLALAHFDLRHDPVSWPRPYPVGYFAGAGAVHFLHYHSIEEARAAWQRRSARMRSMLESPATKLLVKFCDRDGATPEHFARFHRLGFSHKLSLGISGFRAPDHVNVPALKVPQRDLILDGAQLYRLRYRYCDITEWIRSGLVRRTSFSRCFGRVP